MRVYFLRHGKAEDRAAWRGATPTGRSRPRARRSCGARRSGSAPWTSRSTLIVTSPLARARRTAEIVADELGLGGRLVEDDRLAPGFDLRRLEQVLAAHGPAGAVMVVGHEPDFSETIAELIGGGDVVMKKGGLARVDVTAPAAGGGQLVWLLTPPLLGSR